MAKMRSERLIRTSIIRRIVKKGGKRSSAEFLDTLNEFVHRKLNEAIKCHNGKKKTLDVEVAAWVGIR